MSTDSDGLYSHVNEVLPPSVAADRLNRITEEYRKVRSQICNCPWNPDRHADDCPVNILDLAILYPKE